MNMKKFFSLLMAAMMMASVLAGCGGTEETPAEDTQAPAEDTQTPAEGEATGTGTELKFSTRRRPGYLLRLRQRAGAGHHHQRQRNQGHGPWSATAPRTTSSRCR